MKIDEGIPFPDELQRPAGTHYPAAVKYPFRYMKVGDSFLVKTEKDRLRALSAANTFGCTKLGQRTKFKSRKVEGGYRVWRTE